MSEISIKKANYLNDYKIQLTFNNKRKKTIDFEKFLFKHNHPSFNKYRRIENFKKFKIQSGNIVWGKDWDLIFPLHQLYEGKIEDNCN